MITTVPVGGPAAGRGKNRGENVLRLAPGAQHSGRGKSARAAEPGRDESFFEMLAGFFRALFRRRKRKKNTLASTGRSSGGGRGDFAGFRNLEKWRCEEAPKTPGRSKKNSDRDSEAETRANLHPADYEPAAPAKEEAAELAPRYSRPSARAVNRSGSEESRVTKPDAQRSRPHRKEGGGRRRTRTATRSGRKDDTDPPPSPTRAPQPLVEKPPLDSEFGEENAPARYARGSVRDMRNARKGKSRRGRGGSSSASRETSE